MHIILLPTNQKLISLDKVHSISHLLFPPFTFCIRQLALRAPQINLQHAETLILRKIVGIVILVDFSVDGDVPWIFPTTSSSLVFNV